MNTMTQKSLASTESKENFNIFTSLYCSMCLSLTTSIQSEELKDYGVTNVSFNCPGESICWSAHSVFQQRRPLFNKQGKMSYLPELCKNFQKFLNRKSIQLNSDRMQENIEFPESHFCQLGTQCRYAHSVTEINYHPLVYKTNKCELSYEQCSVRKRYCHNYHSEKDKRTIDFTS